MLSINYNTYYYYYLQTKQPMIEESTTCFYFGILDELAQMRKRMSFEGLEYCSWISCLRNRSQSSKFPYETLMCHQSLFFVCWKPVLTSFLIVACTLFMNSTNSVRRKPLLLGSRSCGSQVLASLKSIIHRLSIHFRLN